MAPGVGFEPTSLLPDNGLATGEHRPTRHQKLTTLPATGWNTFKNWLLNHRGLDPKTADSYLKCVTRKQFPVFPESFVSSYKAWHTKGFRLYVHYLYQMGYLKLEERMRWLELLKIRQPLRIKETEIPLDDVLNVFKSDLPHKIRIPLEICYYSGCRVDEATYLLYHLGLNDIPFADLDSFRRYHVDWYRGKKRCDYVYMPSFLAARLECLDVDPLRVSDHCRKHGLLMPKFLRKHFFRVAKQAALENQADPAIADFLQSRVSRMGIGDRYYGILRAETDRIYAKIIIKLIMQ